MLGCGGAAIGNGGRAAAGQDTIGITKPNTSLIPQCGTAKFVVTAYAGLTIGVVAARGGVDGATIIGEATAARDSAGAAGDLYTFVVPSDGAA